MRGSSSNRRAPCTTATDAGSHPPVNVAMTEIVRDITVSTAPVIQRLRPRWGPSRKPIMNSRAEESSYAALSARSKSPIRITGTATGITVSAVHTKQPTELRSMDLLSRMNPSSGWRSLSSIYSQAALLSASERTSRGVDPNSSIRASSLASLSMEASAISLAYFL